MNHTLSYLFLNVTNACNLSCPFCGAAAGSALKSELTLEELKELLKEAKALGIRDVLLGGGEPFLRPDFLEVLRICDSLEIRPSIETNGTLINDEIVEALKGLSSVEIAVSLDGSTAATHEQLRGQKGCFRATLKGIELLADSQIPFFIQTLLSRINYEEIPELMKFANSIYSSYRLLVRALPIGRGKSVRNKQLTAAQIKGLLDFLFEETRKHEYSVDIGVGPALIPPDLLNKNKICDLTASCGVTADGYVGICPLIADFPEFQEGNIREQPLREIWEEGDSFVKLRECTPDDLKGVCGKCRANKTCRGGCRIYAYETYHDFYAPDPLCQEFYESGLFPDYALMDDSHF
jgi:radical SAM protein with 4Fe4S-binding SPASM domain